MAIDYKEYGLEFQVKSQVLRLYGKCAQCGAEQGRQHPETGSRVVLTVHHINQKRKDHELGNLVPLCQRCHLQQHRRNNAQVVEVRVSYKAFVMTLCEFGKYLMEDVQRRALNELKVKGAKGERGWDTVSLRDDGSEKDLDSRLRGNDVPTRTSADPSGRETGIPEVGNGEV